MKSSCYFIFNHSSLHCPNQYSINLHNSLRTHSILVLALSTVEPSWILHFAPFAWFHRYYFSLRRTPTSSSLPRVHPPLLFLPRNCFQLNSVTHLYSRGTDIDQHISRDPYSLLLCDVTAHPQADGHAGNTCHVTATYR
jgi:hypothetical protein